MTRSLVCTLLLACGLAVAQTPKPQPASTRDAALKARIHAFLDRSLGWQGLDKLEVQSISAPDASGLRTATVLLAKGAQTKTGKYYITPDGKEIIEGGEVDKLSGDPWAENRAMIDTRGAPAIGAAGAPVTLVEYSDLECPYCKEESAAIETLLNTDPGKVRVLFKFFPLTQIHPWSMPAAEAGVCVAEQGSDKFWNFEKAVFAAQEKITLPTAPGRLRELASEAGANPAAYDACLLKPATKAAVEASITNGKKLGVASTPTLFINGRLIPGAIPEEQLRMLVDHESRFPAGAAAAKVSLGGQPGGEQCGDCKPLPKIKHQHQF
ncbi:MAG TPA: thioredoxin domain-containing protein [Terriglobales bacterium]|nr:thioredoxin domain-containing protein [Terriglobales bacterium]